MKIYRVYVVESWDGCYGDTFKETIIDELFVDEELANRRLLELKDEFDTEYDEHFNTYLCNVDLNTDGYILIPDAINNNSDRSKWCEILNVHNNDLNERHGKLLRTLGEWYK